MKAHAHPPYGAFAGALLTLSVFAMRVSDSAQRHGHYTATSLGFMAVIVGVGLLLAVVMVRLRSYRLDGDRFVVTRLLGPGRRVEHALADVAALNRRKGGLLISMKDGTGYALFDGWTGSKDMIAKLMSDEARGPGFEPVRSASLQL